MTTGIPMPNSLAKRFAAGFLSASLSACTVVDTETTTILHAPAQSAEETATYDAALAGGIAQAMTDAKFSCKAPPEKNDFEFSKYLLMCRSPEQEGFLYSARSQVRIPKRSSHDVGGKTTVQVETWYSTLAPWSPSDHYFTKTTALTHPVVERMRQGRTVRMVRGGNRNAAKAN